MPTTIAIDERHLASLEIPDSEGEVHSYQMERTPAGLDDWAVLLTRTDGVGESPWRVAVDGEGVWRCSCPDWVYRRRRNRGHKGPCKHMTAARDLYALALELTRREE